MSSSTPYKASPSPLEMGESVAVIPAKPSVPQANPVELVLKSRLPAVMRPQLEQLFFFNLLQTRWREEIRAAVVQYGVPEIIEIEEDVMLVIRGSEQAQSLFAVGVERPDHLLGVVVWGRFCDEEILVLHLAVDRVPFLPAGAENNAGAVMGFAQVVNAFLKIAGRIAGIKRVRFAYWNKTIKLHPGRLKG